MVSPAPTISAAGVPGSTVAIVRSTFDGTPSMKTTARRTMAKTRFVRGPAAMTVTLFQTGARQ